MILNFFNRKTELRALNEAYLSKKAEQFIIYGRRRVGKTALIKEFVRDKPHFYFLAKEQRIDMEIIRFRNKFAEKFDLYLTDTLDIIQFFKEIVEKVPFKEKLIIVIDEFTYWVNKDKAILSEFQYLWDELLADKNIFIILCGSYMSVMENEVMGYKSPLYGRRTGQLKMDPLPIGHIRDFLPGYSTEDLIKIYGAVGTIPFYLKEMSPAVSFEKNMEETFLNKANILNSEAEFMLRQELREVNVYFSIIKSIIDGAVRVSEIADKSRVNITNVNKYLNTLISLKLISKVKSVTASKKESRYIYRLEDNYFRFWLNYIYPYGSEIEENPMIISRIIRKTYSDYMGKVFEDFCMKTIRHFNCGIRWEGTRIGRWWHRDKEIDIVALGEDGILYCECKWKDNVDARKIFSQLKEKSEHVKWNGGKKHYAIFAKSFREKIKEEGLTLFDLRDIGRIFRK